MLTRYNNKLDQKERRLTHETLKDSRLPLTTCINNFNAYEKIDKHSSYAIGWYLWNNNNIVLQVLKTKPLLKLIHLRARKSLIFANKDIDCFRWRKYAFSDESQALAHPYVCSFINALYKKF